jgi:hypothetical protein
VNESRACIYTGLQAHVALTGPYGVVRGSAWSGDRHVTALAVTNSSNLCLARFLTSIFV